MKGEQHSKKTHRCIEDTIAYIRKELEQPLVIVAFVTEPTSLSDLSAIPLPAQIFRYSG